MIKPSSALERSDGVLEKLRLGAASLPYIRSLSFEYAGQGLVTLAESVCIFGIRYLLPSIPITLSIHDIVLYPVYVLVSQFISRNSPKTNGLPFMVPDWAKSMDLPSLKESSHPKSRFKSSSLSIVKYGSKANLGTVFSIRAMGISHVYRSLRGRICSRASSVFRDITSSNVLINLYNLTHLIAEATVKIRNAMHAIIKPVNSFNCRFAL